MMNPRTNINTQGGATSDKMNSLSDSTASEASVPPLAVAVTTRGLKRSGPRHTSTRETRDGAETYKVD